MAFTGDASHIPISNIVQALFLNGQEGVLIVNDGHVERRLRILKLGIRPLAASPKSPDILKSALVKEKILTESEFQNAVSTRDSSSLYPGEFLLRRRLITPEQVENAVRQQLEEIIFDIFSASDLTYEFKAGETALDHELFDPDGLGSSLLFSVNGVLMESARREDDWNRIREEIPSEHEVFVPVGNSLPNTKPKGVDTDDGTYQSLRRLLSGDKTVSRIVEESKLSNYQVHHALFQLKSSGLLRGLSTEEKEKLAEKLRRMLKTKEAIGLYQSILADAPENVRIRTQLISLLEKVKQQPELLIEHYTCLIEHYEREDIDKALACAAKILQIDPDSLHAYESQFVLNILRGNKEAAIASARALVKNIKASRRFGEGADVLIRALDHCPDEPYLLHEIAELFLASGKNDMAVAYLKCLASIYEGRRDLQRLRKTYELMASLDPSQRAALKRLLAEQKRSEAGPGHLLRTVTLTAFVGSLLVASTYIVLIEFWSRDLFAEVERTVDVHLRDPAHQFDRARKSLDEFESTFPFSTKKPSVAKLRARLASAVEDFEEQKVSTIDKVGLDALSAVAVARNLKEQGRFSEALGILEKTLQEASTVDLPPDHRGPIRQLERELGSIQNYFQTAERIRQEVLKAQKQGKIVLANTLVKKLLRILPHAPAAKSVLVPILVKSVPPGATVFLNGKKVGTSPVAITVAPHRPAEIWVQHRGFHEKRLRIQPLREAEHLVALSRTALWKFDTQGPVEAAPLAYGKSVYFANRNGEIFCLTATREEKWKYTVPDRSDLSGGLGLWLNLIYTGCYDGNVYVLNANSGALQGAPIRASAGSLAIKTSPSPASKEGVVVVNCGNTVLSGISLKTRERVWTRTSDTRLLGAPQAWGDAVYAFTRDRLLAYDHNTGKPLPPLSLHGTLYHPGRINEGNAFFGSDDGTVSAVDLNTGTALWEQRIDSPITAPPTISSDYVVLPLASHELACMDPLTGSLKWRVKVGTTIETEGVVFRHRLYIGTGSGHVRRWDMAEGRLVWDYRTQGASDSPPRKILSPGLIYQGQFFQGSADGNIYSFLLVSSR